MTPLVPVAGGTLTAYIDRQSYLTYTYFTDKPRHNGFASDTGTPETVVASVDAGKQHAPIIHIHVHIHSCQYGRQNTTPVHYSCSESRLETSAMRPSNKIVFSLLYDPKIAENERNFTECSSEQFRDTKVKRQTVSTFGDVCMVLHTCTEEHRNT